MCCFCSTWSIGTSRAAGMLRGCSQATNLKSQLPNRVLLNEAMAHHNKHNKGGM